jgi:AcrR family transcriptional regulator
VTKKQKLRNKKKERTEMEILKVTHSLLLERQIDDVTVEDIAEEAFLSRKTIYNYFKNKNDIFFGLGAQILQNANEYTENNFPTHLTGIEQLLFFCDNSFKGRREMLAFFSILAKFYKYITYKDIPIEDIHEYFVEDKGTRERKKTVGHLEEPNLINFYIGLARNAELWIRADKNGKNEGTINNELEDEQIVNHLYVMISGIVYGMNLNKPMLKRIGLEEETIVNNTLDLIAIFLKGK